MHVLKFSVIVEAATGLALVLAPAVVATFLLGADLTGVAPFLARCFGITLLALSMASWPGVRPMEALVPALRGMALYNGMIAVYLGYVGAVEQIRGPLLWPAVALHAVVALLLGVPARRS